MPVYRSFSPDDIAAVQDVRMTVDEFETLRLLDDEGLTQEACASRMNISRTTVTAIYDSARKKVADALVRGKRLLITGGHCEFRPTVSYYQTDFLKFAPFYTILCILVFAIFRLYGGMWRYAGINDMNRIIGASDMPIQPEELEEEED